MNYIQPFLDLFFNVVDRIGTKCAITVGVDYALIYLLINGKISEMYGIGGLVIVTVAYFVQRVNEVKAKAGIVDTTPTTGV